jgi:hypothetical protein
MKDLDQVLARFPQRANEIRRLYLGDTRFRSICEDLSLAYSSLTGPVSDDPGVNSFRHDLCLLRDELESELLTYLSRHPATRH